MLRDKLRALMFGIPIGVISHNIEREKVVCLMDVPLELEYSLRSWLWSQPELVREDLPKYSLRFVKEKRMAIPWDVWEQYLSWMQAALARAADTTDELATR